MVAGNEQVVRLRVLEIESCTLAWGYGSEHPDADLAGGMWYGVTGSRCQLRLNHG